MQVKCPPHKNCKQRVHQSDDGVTTRCGKPIGRSWTVTADAPDCMLCNDTAGGWRRLDKQRRWVDYGAKNVRRV